LFKLLHLPKSFWRGAMAQAASRSFLYLQLCVMSEVPACCCGQRASSLRDGFPLWKVMIQI